MGTWLKAGGLAAALMLANACGAASVNPATPSTQTVQIKSLTVSGTVLGPTGKPMAAVRAEVIQGPSAGQFALTGADGRYQMEISTNGGVVQLRWLRDGYTTTESPIVNAAGSTATIDVNLPRGAWSVTGTVTDLNGVPVSGAGVTLLLLNNREDYSASASSDAAGKFSLTTTRVVYDGEVTVTRSGFMRQSESFSCRPPSADPQAGLCGDRPTIELPMRVARVVGVNLTAPVGTLYVGESAVIRREILLQDGRIVVDDGSGSLAFPGSTISAFDPAVAKVMSGRDALRVWAMAPGDAVLTAKIGSCIGCFQAKLPIHVEARPPSTR